MFGASEYAVNESDHVLHANVTAVLALSTATHPLYDAYTTGCQIACIKSSLHYPVPLIHKHMDTPVAKKIDYFCIYFFVLLSGRVTYPPR